MNVTHLCSNRFLLALGLAVSLLGCFSGCQPPAGPAETDAADSAAATSEADADQDQAAGDSAAASADSQPSGMLAMEQAMAELSAEDRESAKQQQVCPVSGEMLGSMGAPQKVEVEGKTVWICCDGCHDKLMAEPEKYLAQLNK